jgi:hypothetical protein
VNWRRETKGELPSLPHERKALAERYTIDADEADRRAQRAAEQAQAPLSIEPERHAGPAPLNPEPAAEPSEQLVVAAPAQEEQLEQTADLPIYRWFGNS